MTIQTYVAIPLWPPEPEVDAITLSTGLHWRRHHSASKGEWELVPVERRQLTSVFFTVALFQGLFKKPQKNNIIQ